MRSRTMLAILTAFGVVLAACGGAATSPSSGPSSADACGVPVTGKCPSEAQALTGAGATFPGAIYAKWVDEYNRLTGVQVNYQAVGSGGGIKAFTDKTADFGASDVPLTDDQIKAVSGGLYLVPTVMGAVVPTYNIPNVTATLKLTPDALAGIYLGTITKWNDPKIASENTGVELPDMTITTVHRSDGSGTTGVFTDYLSKVSPDWKSKVGSATSVNWPNGVGASGNAGVAGAVKQTPGAIGYVELIYAIQNKLGYGVVKNAAGKYVAASLESTSKAADGFTMPDLGKLAGEQAKISITNSTNPDAWPISTFTFLLVSKDIADKAKAQALVRYAWWGTHEGQAFTKDLGYAPLPANVVKTAEDVLRSVTSAGRKVLPSQ
ncbi:MAG TPA: phosphate ABC transporter substrate-binding protein PstS [Candidatus Limnocylindria bacterium]|nr:phosphate ABC transporter substrate-binding protein PstS [Candidatus Limnocylindria bacterium]